MTEPGHPNQDYPDSLYTPITPELLALLVRMRREHGSWREVAAISATKLRVLRRWYRVERKVITHSALDKLCTATGVGSVEEFTWFTANDLVALGIWDPVELFDGTRGWPTTTKEERQQRKRERRKARQRLKRQQRRDKPPPLPPGLDDLEL